MGRYKENEIMKFLELYRRFECLWKCNHKYYRIKSKRVEAYMHIRDAMNLSSILEVKQKIKSFRDTYASERSKLRRSALIATHPGEVYRPKLRWYNLADSFLNNPEGTSGVDYGMTVEESQNVNNRCTNSNLAPNQPVPMLRNVQEPAFRTANVPHGHQQQHHLNAAHHSYRQEEHNHFIPVQRGGQQNFNQPPTNLNTFERSDRNIEETGEFYHFSMNIAMQLRSLPIVRALSVQNRIQQILCEERIAYEQSRYQTEQPAFQITNYLSESRQESFPTTQNTPVFEENIPVETSHIEEHIKDEYSDDDVIEIANGAL